MTEKLSTKTRDDDSVMWWKSPVVTASGKSRWVPPDQVSGTVSYMCLLLPQYAENALPGTKFQTLSMSHRREISNFKSHCFPSLNSRVSSAKIFFPIH